ncbi:MAG: hypothetical protein QXY05_00885 [Candidatus Anstonellales archaeon]
MFEKFPSVNELKNDKKFLFLLLLGILMLAGIFMYPVYVGFLLIISLLIFGTLSSVWKESHIRLSALFALIILAISAIAVHGIKFGIDFEGGTRIPIVLEYPVNQIAMQEMVETIKKRASVLGLTEVKVKAVGNSEIYVELPSADEEMVKRVEGILEKQGVYLGVVDGKVAITGQDILPGTIYRIPTQYLQGNDWGVGFSITKTGAEHFAETVKGKANYPLYMFLDRPTNAFVVVNREQLKQSLSESLEIEDALSAMKEALELEGDNTVIIFEEDVLPGMNLSNRTYVVLRKNAPQSVKDIFSSAGIMIKEVEDSEMIPEISYGSAGTPVVAKWEGVGLLSSPFLSPQITDGIPSYSYSITGPASGVGQEKVLNAERRVKEIESILKGGALPVRITLGSKTTIPAPLGQEFLRLSLLGLVFAFIIVSAVIFITYRKLRVILPIILITLAEITILIAITGSFTIDLATMAGIIAAVGVSIDAQIIITDELLKKTGTKEEKLDRAMSIINTNVTVAILAMLPLLFSGMVEIIGFAVATILGALLGALISRPAYATIAGELVA